MCAGMAKQKRNKMNEKDFIKTLPNPAFLHKADGTRLTKKELNEFIKFMYSFYKQEHKPGGHLKRQQ